MTWADHFVQQNADKFGGAGSGGGPGGIPAVANWILDKMLDEVNRALKQLGLVIRRAGVELNEAINEGVHAVTEAFGDAGEWASDQAEKAGDWLAGRLGF